MTHSSPARSLPQPALRVIGVTAVAWGVKLPSAHALARRAPHGHVPARRQRALARLHAQLFGSTPALAHSW